MGKNEFGFIRFMRSFGKLSYRMRSVVLAIPVAVAATGLALYNMVTLPANVGINIQETGEFAQVVGRGTAVVGPLLLTGICLALMFCSRRVIYPWLISLFSLVLPLVILITNIFPG